MFSALFFTAIDPHLSRLEYDLLSDQALMEMLVEPSSSVRGFQDRHGSYLDVCSWGGVNCDSDGNVIQFEASRALSGSVELSFLPKNVRKVRLFSMHREKVQGTVETSTLPVCMLEFRINYSKFSGTLDLTTLPPLIKLLDVEDNTFSGSCDLTKLPSELHLLSLGENHFSGSLSLRQLPPSLESLRIHGNRFSGAFELTKLSNPVIIIAADCNCFESVAVVTRETARIALWAAQVKNIVDADGNQHPHEKEMLTRPPTGNDEELEFLLQIEEGMQSEIGF